MTTAPKIFATCNIGDEALELLRKAGFELEVYPETSPPPKDLILKQIKSGITALITTLRDPLDAEVFEAAHASNLKLIAQDAVGFDNIDINSANKFKIPVAHTPDVLTESTAEFAFAILLAVARKLYSSEKLVENNEWGCWHPFKPFLGTQVSEKTVAVIGTGRIGKSFIQKCVGFEMNVLCYDAVYEDTKFISQMQELMDFKHKLGLSEKKRFIKYTDFDYAISNADFISLHVPLTRDGSNPTYHLINKSTLQKMKKTCFVINTSRGPVVDEDALYQALVDDTIAGAALDVYAKEPLPKDSKLRDPKIRDKLRLFPHFASATNEARLSVDPAKGMAGRTVRTVIDFLQNNVNVQDLPIINKNNFK